MNEKQPIQIARKKMKQNSQYYQLGTDSGGAISISSSKFFFFILSIAFVGCQKPRMQWKMKIAHGPHNDGGLMHIESATFQMQNDKIPSDGAIYFIFTAGCLLITNSSDNNNNNTRNITATCAPAHTLLQ